jgi:hypothetical protein
VPCKTFYTQINLPTNQSLTSLLPSTIHRRCPGHLQTGPKRDTSPAQKPDARQPNYRRIHLKMLPLKGSCDNLSRTPAAETFEIQTKILTRNSSVLFAENVQKRPYQLLLSPFSAIHRAFTARKAPLDFPRLQKFLRRGFDSTSPSSPSKSTICHPHVLSIYPIRRPLLPLFRPHFPTDPDSLHRFPETDSSVCCINYYNAAEGLLRPLWKTFNATKSQPQKCEKPCFPIRQ